VTRENRDKGRDFVFPKMDIWKETGLSRWPVFDEKDRVIRELHFELTYRCNLKCRMCDLWGQGAADPTKIELELSFDEIRRFVDGSRRLGDVQVVVLSGGESLLRADLADIVSYFTTKMPNASVGILTNLSSEALLRSRLEEIFKKCRPNLWLGSSIDGIGEMHDRVRGVPGSYDRMMKTIAMVKKDYPKMDVSLTYTLLPENYRHFLPTYELAEKIGCHYGAQFVVQKEGTDVFRWTRKQLDEISADIDQVIDRLLTEHDAMGRIFRGESADSQWLWTRLFYWRILKQYGDRPRRYIKPCLAGRRYAMLDPWGNVSFCSPHKKKPVGNIRETDFDALWDGDKARRLRGHIDEGRCDCWLMCTANPVLDKIMQLACSSPGPVTGGGS